MLGHQLPNDFMRTVLNRLTATEAINYCNTVTPTAIATATGTVYTNICDDEMFWRDFIMNKYDHQLLWEITSFPQTRDQLFEELASRTPQFQALGNDSLGAAMAVNLEQSVFVPHIQRASNGKPTANNKYMISPYDSLSIALILGPHENSYMSGTNIVAYVDDNILQIESLVGGTITLQLKRGLTINDVDQLTVDDIIVNGKQLIDEITLVDSVSKY